MSVIFDNRNVDENEVDSMMAFENGFRNAAGIKSLLLFDRI